MEALPSTSSLLEDNSQSSSATGSNSTSQGSSEAPSTTSTFSTTSDTTSDEEDTSQDEEDSGSSDISSSTYSDTLNSMTSSLEQFLLHKYKMKQPIMKENMLKIIHPRYHDRFAKILKRAAEHIEAVSAVDLKEADSTIHSYDLVSKLYLPNNGRVWDGRGLPETGLLMTVLGVIFVKGHCAAEEDIWKFLNMMRVYAGRKHFIYGEPRKLITKDFVTMKYLEYRQVANGDLPRYEFLWAHEPRLKPAK